MTRDVRRKGGGRTTGRDLRTYGDSQLETDAASLRIHTIELLPGLLQTRSTHGRRRGGSVWESPEIDNSSPSGRAPDGAAPRGPLQLWAVMHEMSLSSRWAVPR